MSAKKKSSKAPKSDEPGINRLYLGQVVWVQTMKYPWWPVFITNPAKVLPAVLKHKKPGHFVFKYLGHTDLGWAPNDTRHVRLFRHAEFDAMAKHKQIAKALEEAQEIEEDMKVERGDKWDEQPDTPDEQYLYVPFSKPEWDDDEEEELMTAKKKAAPKKAAAKRAPKKNDSGDDFVDDESDEAAAVATTTAKTAKRSRATKDPNAPKTVKKPRNNGATSAKKKSKAELAAEKLERRKERAALRIAGTKAPVAAEDMTETTFEELNAIALDLVTQLKNHNGAKVMLLFANLKRKHITRDLLRKSAIGKKIKLLSQSNKNIDPLYDEAIQEIANEIYQSWRAIWAASTDTTEQTQSKRDE